MPFNMHPELKDKLCESLAHRAARLTDAEKLKHYPSAVIALFAEHIISTAIALVGDQLADQLIERTLRGIRRDHGLCVWCGERPCDDRQPMCAVCLAECLTMDDDIKDYIE